MQYNKLLNKHNSIPQTVFAKEQPNENSLIVEKINPISHCCPAHHGTVFNVLIDKLCSHKHREMIIFAHNLFILKETKQEQHFVVFFSSKYSSLEKDIRYLLKH